MNGDLSLIDVFAGNIRRSPPRFMRFWWLLGAVGFAVAASYYWNGKDNHEP
jgi:hypothetical protein